MEEENNEESITPINDEGIDQPEGQEELEEAVTGHAYRLERDKAKDEVTKVVLLT